ncbi:MAG: TIGR02452 family protein [Chloroflexi bacterium]|nr:TIGR02452 family protein [Chloroflexota bacterium]
MRIAAVGRYEIGGRTVHIADAVRQAVSSTKTFSPDALVPSPQPGKTGTRTTVANETTLAAGARFVAAGKRVLALNFASPSHPGGGFLDGALAQEETLARSSALYTCLKDSPMYAYHWKHRDPLFADYVIISPDVPVFRSDNGDLLAEPYLCSFITSPAVHKGFLLEEDPRRAAEIGPVMRLRINKVLGIAALYRHDVLVLGAWGCGAFENNPVEIAGLFSEALSGAFRDVFPSVHFAVYDRWEDRRQITPFERQFA